MERGRWRRSRPAPALQPDERGPGAAPSAAAFSVPTEDGRADAQSPTPALFGLVLAGGGSVRMGADKARLVLEGEPLVVRAARRLEEVCERVLIASGDGARLGDLPWRQVADAVPGAGPLGGIIAGLEAATTPLVAVVAVDMPDLNPTVLVRLAAQWRSEPAIVPLVAGRVQPLHGVYAKTAAPALRRALADGRRSVIAALSDVGARVVGEEGWGDIDPTGGFVRNVNRPEDLEAR